MGQDTQRSTPEPCPSDLNLSSRADMEVINIEKPATTIPDATAATPEKQMPASDRNPSPQLSPSLSGQNDVLDPFQLLSAVPIGDVADPQVFPPGAEFIKSWLM